MNLKLVVCRTPNRCHYVSLKHLKYPAWPWGTPGVPWHTVWKLPLWCVSVHTLRFGSRQELVENSENLPKEGETMFKESLLCSPHKTSQAFRNSLITRDSFFPEEAALGNRGANPHSCISKDAECVHVLLGKGLFQYCTDVVPLLHWSCAGTTAPILPTL